MIRRRGDDQSMGEEKERRLAEAIEANGNASWGYHGIRSNEEELE